MAGDKGLSLSGEPLLGLLQASCTQSGRESNFLLIKFRVPLWLSDDPVCEASLGYKIEMKSRLSGHFVQ
jgi:hypothetical protein